MAQCVEATTVFTLFFVMKSLIVLLTMMAMLLGFDISTHFNNLSERLAREVAPSSSQHHHLFDGDDGDGDDGDIDDNEGNGGE